MSVLQKLLSFYKIAAQTPREAATYFENLTVDFIKGDPGMVQQFETAWPYSQWAAEQGIDKRDTGIDVVAKIRGEESYCAVQCKFYAQDHRIQKSDIDSFFTASGKSYFSLRLIIDTTAVPWSDNAENALDNQNPPVQRIGLDRLEQSPIDWSIYFAHQEIKLAGPKQLRPDQQEACDAVRLGLTEADRGKLLMACGTGKTFTALKIAQDMVGVGNMALYLVPSLSLLNQTIRAWTIDASIPIRAFAVCSDSQVGKHRKFSDENDVAEIEAHDLDYPATTDATKLGQKASVSAPDRMTVIFSTYQSIDVISQAQKEYGLPAFKLIICDEAHRTTGATLENQEHSDFLNLLTTKVASNCLESQVARWQFCK